MSIKCEVCGCEQIIKKNGVFVCQGCGIQYSVNELRGKMSHQDSDQQLDVDRYYGSTDDYDIKSNEDGTVDIALYVGSLKHQDKFIVANYIDGKKVKRIGEKAFAGLKFISTLVVPRGIEEICAFAFSECDIQDVVFSQDLRKIGNAAFYWNDLQKVVIPEGVVEIGSREEYYPYKSDTLGAFQFNMESLTEVVLPSSLRLLGTQSFHDNHALEKVTIADGLEIIEDHAFADCWHLCQIFIPSSVRFIHPDSFDRSGYYKHGEGKNYGSIDWDQKRLLSIDVNEGSYANTFFKNLDDEGIIIKEISKKKNKKIKRINGNPEHYRIREQDDDTCEILCYIGPSEDEIVIPNYIGNRKVVGIAGFAAYPINESLRKVVISEGIQYIEDDSFAWCKTLVSISFPQTLVRIGTIEAECKDKPYKYTWDGDSYMCYPWREKHSGAFQGCMVKKLELPSSLRILEHRAFKDCTRLQSVHMGKSISFIGEEAFQGCTSLSEITILGVNPTFSAKCFFDCPKVESLVHYYFKDSSLLQPIYTGPNLGMPEGINAFNNDLVIKEVDISVSDNYPATRNEFIRQQRLHSKRF